MKKMMRSGDSIEQRDIILIPFPYTDFSNAKVRSTLILSNNRHIQKQADMVCCAITSQKSDFFEAVKVDNSHMDRGELKETSWVLIDNLMTIEQGEIQKTIGKLNIEKSKTVAEKVDAIIEIEE